MQTNDPQSNVMLDWRLRATTIANDIVFKESVSEETKQLTCWLQEMSADITNKLGKPTTEKSIKDCEANDAEITIANLIVPTATKNGVLAFDIDGVTFKIHQSILLEDARFCVESVLDARNINDDILCMENPIIELGIPRNHYPLDIAEAFPQEGIISFYKHQETGRLWACAIDKLTSSDSSGYRHTTVRHIAQHEFSHIMELNPSVDELNESVALKLNEIRAIPDDSLRKTAIEELLNIGHALNPKYCPMKIIDWADSTFGKSSRGAQGRPSQRHNRKDELLAKELVAEALTTIRGDGQALPKELETPTSQLKGIIEAGLSFKTVAIKWTEKTRKHELIPVEKWRPTVRLAQTPPAFEYNSLLFESLERRSMGGNPGRVECGELVR